MYTWIEINKIAFEHNVAQLKSIIKGELAAVIKSNAYGHGMLQIAHLCQESKHVDWLCVANLSDALKLDAHGITKPILVMSCIDEDPARANGKNISFVVPDMMTANQLNSTGNFRIHIKIDTGLRRFGFEPEDTLKIIEAIKNMPNLHIEGIMTHFAQSQKPDQSFTYAQLAKYDHILQELEKRNIKVPYKHVANSAATMRFDLPQCNLFRVGVGIYGWWPNQPLKDEVEKKHPKFSLRPIITWKTRVNNLKTIPANQPVGYDCTVITTRETKVAFIPVGYFDGFDFRLSNTGFVNISGKPAPILGRVSMNVATIDVTDIDGIKVGDEVIILGSYEKVTAYDWVQNTGNPNIRELITTIHPSIERHIVEQEIDKNQLCPNKNLANQSQKTALPHRSP